AASLGTAAAAPPMLIGTCTRWLLSAVSTSARIPANASAPATLAPSTSRVKGFAPRPARGAIATPDPDSAVRLAVIARDPTSTTPAGWIAADAAGSDSTTITDGVSAIGVFALGFER